MRLCLLRDISTNHLIKKKEKKKLNLFLQRLKAMQADIYEVSVTAGNVKD